MDHSTGAATAASGTCSYCGEEWDSSSDYVSKLSCAACGDRVYHTHCVKKHQSRLGTRAKGRPSGFLCMRGLGEDFKTTLTKPCGLMIKATHHVTPPGYASVPAPAPAQLQRSNKKPAEPPVSGYFVRSAPVVLDKASTLQERVHGSSTTRSCIIPGLDDTGTLERAKKQQRSRKDVPPPPSPPVPTPSVTPTTPSFQEKSFITTLEAYNARIASMMKSAESVVESVKSIEESVDESEEDKDLADLLRLCLGL